jgi:N-acetylneuraminate synthase
VDADFSLEPDELKHLCLETKNTALAVGKINYSREENEKKNMIFRRSIYVVKDIKKGEVFTKDNIKIIRPGYGDRPSNFTNWIGKKVRFFMARGTALKEDN